MTKLRKVNNYIWEIPKEPPMKVPVKIYSSEDLLKKMKEDNTLIQAKNVASLPGILKHMIVMPDGHQGYGMPVGGVAAFDAYEGLISPGMTGFDINCGVRLLRTTLTKESIKSKLKLLVDLIFRKVPSGVGEESNFTFSWGQFRDAVERGVDWAIEEGFGWEEDKDYLESYGVLYDADFDVISDKAKKRGISQLGTLGSGNHFIEIQYVKEIFDEELAKKFGIERKGQIFVMIHTGSRGFGHQIATDYIMKFEKRFRDIAKKLPDKDLIYAPANTKEAEEYFKAMCAAANFAWANRQIITHIIRQCFKKIYQVDPEEIGLNVIYDLAHNIVKKEIHKIDGSKKEVYVHRKGATRAFPAGHPELNKVYSEIGQPVIIPGSIGTNSYLLIAQPQAMNLAFGSSAHGAGRTLSRRAATKKIKYKELIERLEKQGIYVRSATKIGLVEEAPEAYKDSEKVVDVIDNIGIAKKIVSFTTLAVIKG